MNHPSDRSILHRKHCPETVFCFLGVFLRWHLVFSVAFLLLAGAAVVPPAARADATAEPPPYTTITIQKGDTLAGICRAHMGAYSNAFIQQILALNPDITDKNHIVAGRVLRLPLIIKAPDALRSKKEIDQGRVMPPSAEPEPEPKPEPEVIDAIFADNLPDLETGGKISADDRLLPKAGGASADEYMPYPPPMPGRFVSLTWLSDNRALVKGMVSRHPGYDFYVYVPGDLEYPQANLDISGEGVFQIEAVIGRAGRDYGQSFVLKLALLNENGERISEIKRTIVRTRHEIGDTIPFPESTADGYVPQLTGWEGLETWISVQSIDAMRADNYLFRVPGGRLVPNYRYIGYNPDEKYLSWYGRVTLYGSACMAKALLLKGDTAQAEAILRVWAAQMGPNGKIPRSANVIGDNYTSPDVRSGEIAHFLGALALARMVTEAPEWEEPIHQLVNRYFIPLMDLDIGLVQGGYNGTGSQGYNRPLGYTKVPWFSAEHNFDLFQALVLVTRIRELDPDFREKCKALYRQIGQGIDAYLWDDAAGTFNRGWRRDTGPDQARALDCSSWGALYCLKQAALAMGEDTDTTDTPRQREYLKKALSCLEYAENNFKTLWKYRNGPGSTGTIEGYRPYDGKIHDLMWEDGHRAGRIIDWDLLDNMIWSEGSLGVAKAWEEYGRMTGSTNQADEKSRRIYEQMKILQSLSDQGGLLYSTRQIKGHFTMGEELASLSWLGYLALMHESGLLDWQRCGKVIDWVPW